MGKTKQQVRSLFRASQHKTIHKKISKQDLKGDKCHQQDDEKEKKLIDLEYGDVIILQNNNNSQQQYRILDKIDQGGQGNVYDCVKLTDQNQSDNSNLFAFKVFKYNQDPRYLETYGFVPKNQNILKYYAFGYFEKDLKLYQAVVMEKCDYNLKQHLIQKGKEQGKDTDKQGQLKKQEALNILKQILNGYMSLINYGIAHRDLKPSNILFNIKDDIWKIGDFGLSRFQEGGLKTKQGTVGYKSPQIQFEERVKYTSKCDVYSLGIMFYELLYGELPWPINSPLYPNLYVNFKKKKLGVQLKNFIKQCLKYDEKDRLSWEQVYSHPIFKGQFQTNVKQIMMIDGLNSLKNEASLHLANDLREQATNNQISLEQLLDYFKDSSKFSKMKLITVYCLFGIKKICQVYLNQDELVEQPISQAQMAQNGHLACLLTFYLSQIHQPKESTQFFKEKDISERDYLAVLQIIDNSISVEDVKYSFGLLSKNNNIILHKDFLELFQYDFLK